VWNAATFYISKSQIESQNICTFRFLLTLIFSWTIYEVWLRTIPASLETKSSSSPYCTCHANVCSLKMCACASFLVPLICIPCCTSHHYSHHHKISHSSGLMECSSSSRAFHRRGSLMYSSKTETSAGSVVDFSSSSSLSLIDDGMDTRNSIADLPLALNLPLCAMHSSPAFVLWKIFLGKIFCGQLGLARFICPTSVSSRCSCVTHHTSSTYLCLEHLQLPFVQPPLYVRHLYNLQQASGLESDVQQLPLAAQDSGNQADAIEVKTQFLGQTSLPSSANLW